MEHLEMHVITTPHDTELAVVAGLIDEFADLSCKVCDEVIPFTNIPTANRNMAVIILSEDDIVISCETCLTDAIQTLML